MTDDQIFRLILIAGFAIIMPAGIYFRVKSQATRESLDRRQEGLFVLATLRPLGIASVLGLITYMVDPAWMAWSAVSLPALVRWPGVGVGAVAGSLLVWTMHTLGKNLTDTVVTRKEHELVTGGPYRFWSASLLLRLHTRRPRQLDRCRQLVPLVDRSLGLASDRLPHQQGRREPDREIRRRVSQLHGTHRALLSWAAESTALAPLVGV
jgi:protein-S-isoprenylcysteine O-methyltransferase Ste14